MSSPTLSPAQHAVATALKGRSLAAADSVLLAAAEPGARYSPGAPQTAAGVVESAALGLLEAFKPADAAGRRNLLHALVRLGMSLVGSEARFFKLSDEDVRASVAAVRSALIGMEMTDKAAAGAVVDSVLADMRSVNAGDSLPAQLAEDIRAAVEGADCRAAELVHAFGKRAETCIYTVMSRERRAKFGNDYARGLEYLRHVGYVQVSTNPVLAAKAFDEDPALVEEFKAEAAKRPEWKTAAAANADAMTLRATLIALWPNLTVFRPPAIRAGNMDFMVSFQLNPNIADRAEESLADARAAYEQATAFLADYDKALGLEEPGAARPCLVFKVAGSHPAARTITRELNAAGIGTNNTVVYTVAQEVRLILDAFEGKARAVKAGRPVTRTYETNMGGRFASHLREAEAERIVAAAGASAAPLVAELAAAVKAPAGAAVKDIVAFKNLKTLDHPAFLAVAAKAGLSADEVRTLEADIKKSGTLVARRVWRIFFSPVNRSKWVGWLGKTYALTSEQAKLIHESMDVLPASKRIVEDTLHALGYPNMCHTEFPNHARAVELFARREGFKMAEYADSLSAEYPAEVVQRLSRIPDFVAGYELPASLADLLVRDVGLPEAADYGRRGLTEDQWPTYGAVVKTVTEFRAAYDGFRDKLVKIAAGA
jgi:transaldolase